jgi:hypothetical protein
LSGIGQGKSSVCRCGLPALPASVPWPRHDRINGRKTASNDPDLGAWSDSYNTLGQLVSQTGRQLQRVEPDMTSQWVYDTAGPFINGPDRVASFVANTVIGGVAAVVGGGKFENGAIAAAFGYLFNAAQDHEQPRILRIGPADPFARALAEALARAADAPQNLPQSTYAIGRMPAIPEAETLGYSTYDPTPNPDSLSANDAWVQRVIEQRGTVYLASPIEGNLIPDSVWPRILAV